MAVAQNQASIGVSHLISHFKKETKDTFTIRLKAQKRFRFLPGQFNMLYMFGVGEVPISISGDAQDQSTIVHTIRAYGSVTGAMLNGLKTGDFIGLRGPFGNSWPIEELKGHDVFLAAGGIGLAPLRPVLYHCLNNRADFGRITLIYGERSPNALLYRKELESWRGRFDMDVQVTVDHAGADWRGNVGVVTTLLEKITLNPKGTIALVCGPEVMMHYTVLELKKQGLNDEQVYISMERNMKCATGFCGHCQMGPIFVCKDGPVFRYDQMRELYRKREL